MKAPPIDIATIPEAKNADERTLEEIQARVAAHADDINRRNAILFKLSEKGMTHRELAARLTRASGSVVVEDTVQKAIRKHRESQ